LEDSQHALRVVLDGRDGEALDSQIKPVELGLARMIRFDPDKHGEHNLDRVGARRGMAGESNASPQPLSRGRPNVRPK